jgi:hypothetical protein
MRYLQALEQKGLKKEDLAKQTQKKIEDLEYRKAQVEEDADDYDEEDLKKILGMIKKFDEELEKSILKFNPEIYKKRVEVFERNKKLAREQEQQQEEEDEYVDFSNDEDDEVEVEKVQPQVQVQPQQVQPQQVAKPQPQQEVAKPQVEVEEEDLPTKNNINARLDELESRVETNSEKFKFEKEQRTHRKIEVEEEDEAEEVEVEEIEDYKNKGSIKPKKMSTSIILMGVGAFLLTWGAVNFFRERR